MNVFSFFFFFFCHDCRTSFMSNEDLCKTGLCYPFSNGVKIHPHSDRWRGWDWAQSRTPRFSTQLISKCGEFCLLKDKKTTKQQWNIQMNVIELPLCTFVYEKKSNKPWIEYSRTLILLPIVSFAHGNQKSVSHSSWELVKARIQILTSAKVF